MKGNLVTARKMKEKLGTARRMKENWLLHIE